MFRMIRPLRVLLAGDTVSVHSVRLAAALSRRGVSVCVLNGPGLVERVRDGYGAVVENVAYDERRLRGNARLAGVGRLEARLNRLRLRRRVGRCGADVVHVNNLYCGERLDRLVDAGRLPLPLVVTAWGTDVDDSAIAKHPSYPPIRRTLLERATLVTAWGEAMVDRCRALVPERPAEDFRAIRWNPDLTGFHTEAARSGRRVWRERLGLRDDTFVFISPRATRPNYQIDRIVRAFVQAFGASKTAPVGRFQDVALVVTCMGADRADSQAYLQRLRDEAAPAAGRVHFVDAAAHADVPALFGMADAAVSIPMADGGPATHPELMALGVPLLAADLVDYRGILESQRNALVFDATADAPVAEVMRRIVTDDALRERIRAEALTWVHEQGSFDDTIDAYLHAYHAAIARFARGRSVGFASTTRGAA